MRLSRTGRTWLSIAAVLATAVGGTLGTAAAASAQHYTERCNPRTGYTAGYHGKWRICIRGYRSARGLVAQGDLEVVADSGTIDGKPLGLYSAFASCRTRPRPDLKNCRAVPYTGSWVHPGQGGQVFGFTDELEFRARGHYYVVYGKSQILGRRGLVSSPAFAL